MPRACKGPFAAEITALMMFPGLTSLASMMAMQAVQLPFKSSLSFPSSALRSTADDRRLSCCFQLNGSAQTWRLQKSCFLLDQPHLLITSRSCRLQGRLQVWLKAGVRIAMHSPEQGPGTFHWVGDSVLEGLLGIAHEGAREEPWVNALLLPHVHAVCHAHTKAAGPATASVSQLLMPSHLQGFRVLQSIGHQPQGSLLLSGADSTARLSEAHAGGRRRASQLYCPTRSYGSWAHAQLGLATFEQRQYRRHQPGLTLWWCRSTHPPLPSRRTCAQRPLHGLHQPACQDECQRLTQLMLSHDLFGNNHMLSLETSTRAVCSKVWHAYTLSTWHITAMHAPGTSPRSGDSAAGAPVLRQPQKHATGEAHVCEILSTRKLTCLSWGWSPSLGEGRPQQRRSSSGASPEALPVWWPSEPGLSAVSALQARLSSLTSARADAAQAQTGSSTFVLICRRKWYAGHWEGCW